MYLKWMQVVTCIAPYCAVFTYASVVVKICSFYALNKENNWKNSFNFIKEFDHGA